ncbi:MAG: hypothetical protein K2P93_07990 [Alphaproteobacteria bacterium]|nr:hypothetical protein [Alphaproteobacteria bacterium]
MKRRLVVEAVIDDLKNDGHLGKSYLKDTLSDKVNAILQALAITLGFSSAGSEIFYSLLFKSSLEESLPQDS